MWDFIPTPKPVGGKYSWSSVAAGDGFSLGLVTGGGELDLEGLEFARLAFIRRRLATASCRAPSVPRTAWHVWGGLAPVLCMPAGARSAEHLTDSSTISAAQHYECNFVSTSAHMYSRGQERIQPTRRTGQAEVHATLAGVGACHAG
jgi:hypothetical protein